MADAYKNLDELRKYFEPGENNECTIGGAYEIKMFGNDSIRSGILSATNKRVIFYGKKLGGYDMEVFPYENISSIEASKGILGYTVSLFASGNIVKMKLINSGDVNKFISLVRSRIGKKQDVSRQIDGYDAIEKLGVLYEKGILTEEEFKIKKTELLHKL